MFFIKYLLFAVMAILANLLVQRIVFASWQGPETVVIAIGFGTIAGLLVKYWLDARWIFYATRPRSEMAQFGRYSMTGVATTLVFWGCEGLGWYLSGDHMIRELSAIVGLSIGYVLKYQLDKRFVFSTQPTGGH